MAGRLTPIEGYRMKKFIALACLAALPAVCLADELYVCTGLVGSDTVTLVDTGYQVWVVKGTFDIQEGPGSLPKHLFRQQVIRPSRVAAGQCSLVVAGQNSMTFNSDCGDTPTNAAATLSLNIPALGLSATDAPVTCNIINVGNDEVNSGPAPEDSEALSQPLQDETAH
jgi:hypothetical protein